MDEFSRYHRLLLETARPTLEAACPVAATDDARGAKSAETQGSVALAAAAGRLLLGDEPALYEGLARGFEELAKLGETCAGGGGGGAAAAGGGGKATPMLADGLGHKRAVYWPLVVHLHLAAFAKRYESLPVSVWSRCETVGARLVELMRVVERFADRPPGPLATPMVLWRGLCLCEQAVLAGREADVEWLDSVVHKIVQRAGPDGSLHPQGGPGIENREAPSNPATESEKPASGTGVEYGLDAWTYGELTGLHALANLALLRRNQTWAKRVREIALYHLERTQPDHVTAQPWGVFAFLWSPGTRIFADQQIHDAAAYGAHWSAPTVGQPQADSPEEGSRGVSVLAGLLLADAAACVGSLIQPDGSSAAVGARRG